MPYTALSLYHFPDGMPEVTMGADTICDQMVLAEGAGTIRQNTAELAGPESLGLPLTIVRWSGPGVSKVAIPASVLKHQSWRIEPHPARAQRREPRFLTPGQGHAIDVTRHDSVGLADMSSVEIHFEKGVIWCIIGKVQNQFLGRDRVISEA
jgi:hypothetical protein